MYADDTLLFGSCESRLQRYLEYVIAEGRRYGLQINWGKVECMAINCHSSLKDSEGSPIKMKTGIKYLGANLSANNFIDM